MKGFFAGVILTIVVDGVMAVAIIIKKGEDAS